MGNRVLFDSQTNVEHVKSAAHKTSGETLSLENIVSKQLEFGLISNLRMISSILESASTKPAESVSVLN